MHHLLVVYNCALLREVSFHCSQLSLLSSVSQSAGSTFFEPILHEREMSKAPLHHHLSIALVLGERFPTFRHECKVCEFAHFGSAALFHFAIVFPCAWLRSASSQIHTYHVSVFQFFIWHIFNSLQLFKNE